MEFTGKTAISTGAASGMGLLFAQNWAELGGNVVMCDVNEQVLNEKVAEINAKGKGKLVLSFMELGQKNRENALGKLVIDINSTEWQSFNGEMIAPNGTKEIWVEFIAGLDNTVSVDNVSLKLF